MTRRFGLGLRAQIVIALSVAFIASFPLLGLAAVQLTQRARERDRVADAQATARVVAAAVPAAADRRARFNELVDVAIGRGGIAGAELTRGDLEPYARGVTGQGTPVEVAVEGGGAVRLWVRRPAPESTTPLANMLLLYVAVTGGAIMLLAYLVITYLIVRPVEALTRASERLAAGQQHVGVPVRGGAEVARLAVAFNAMASQLRDERESLELRLEELERTTVELRSAQDQVLRSARLASVGRLSAGVAHEIGNPLAAILGLIELLRDGGLEPDEQAEFLRRIQAETERIHKIIRELLDFSRQADEPTREATADLEEVVEDAVRLVAPQKDLRDVTIERRIAEDTPRVRGDADRLTQIVLNLLLNAADAIEREGGITIEVGPSEREGRVSLVVTDTGPGIAEDVLEHLFEPFVTTKPTGQGTGLGLAVCHTLVERMGGTIRADNAPTGGARFEVDLEATT